jgi:hypothetical protein
MVMLLGKTPSQFDNSSSQQADGSPVEMSLFREIYLNTHLNTVRTGGAFNGSDKN